MNESKISVRYSKALFGLAKEEKVLEEVMNDQKFLESIYTIPEFKLLIENPVIKASQKQKIIRNIFTGKLNKVTLTFLDLLFHNRREIFLPEITRNFFDEFRKEKGILPVELKTVVKVDDETKEKLINTLKTLINSDIELHEKIDPSLIGGFVLTINDKQYDSSVSAKLNKIKKELINSSLENIN
jgi:F-type H+-transporting ATPase subunit delta